jgi:hypothetical protein
MQNRHTAALRETDTRLHPTRAEDQKSAAVLVDLLRIWIPLGGVVVSRMK